ncbi:hypothetical protein BC628DRAFT_905972 [Trametes gibbosa]|nr:hypothetical protein BC628DRAFT_905972 [Trametes gibbosa]
MSSGAMQSNVGNSQVYEHGDQKNPATDQSSQERPAGLGQKNAHNIFDSKDNRKLDVRMQQEHKLERQTEQSDNTKTVTDPLEPAQRQGHEPSRGAKIDAELQKEDEETVRNMGPFNDMSQ